ncbi:MAG: hypothetical protein K0R31_1622, partial [Clostridiales bacterium]|nr:hypothetical protein [Clostridiales bacterium]
LKTILGGSTLISAEVMDGKLECTIKPDFF